MEKSVLMAGFGGQGVMTIGQIVGYAATHIGLKATYFPSYGAEQRGGTANCTVVISDEEIGSPIRNQLDAVIAMNEPSLIRFAEYVKEDGMLLINSSLIHSDVIDKSVKVFRIPAGEIAYKIGNEKSANLVMLGAYIAIIKTIDPEIIRLMISEKLGKSPDLKIKNLLAFEAGINEVDFKGEFINDYTFKKG